MIILMLVMLAFICGLFARRVIDLMTTLVKNLRRIRLEIDLGDDGALTAKQQLAAIGVKPRSLVSVQCDHEDIGFESLERSPIDSKSTDENG